MNGKAALFLLMLGLVRQAAAEELRVNDAQVTLIRDVTVPATLDGRIERIAVREGDTVQQAEILVAFDDELVRAEMRRAEADVTIASIQQQNDVDLRFARKSLEVHERELERSQQANQRFPDSVSRTELERLRLVVEQSKLAIEQAERDRAAAEASLRMKQAEYDAVAVRLHEHQVHSPLDGVVLEVARRAGEWVAKGDPLVRIVDLERLRVEVLVDGHRCDQSLVGQPMRFLPRATTGDADGDAAVAGPEYQGVIVFVSPELHPVTGQVRVWAELENAQRQLRPGMRGAIQIVLPDQTN